MRWYILVTDIDEGKRAEKALEKAYEEIRRLTADLRDDLENDGTSIVSERRQFICWSYSCSFSLDRVPVTKALGKDGVGGPADNRHTTAKTEPMKLICNEN